MDSTQTLEKTDPPGGDKAAPAPGQAPDKYARAEDALSKLVAAARAEVRPTTNPPPSGPASDFAAEPRVATSSINLADLMPEVAPPQSRGRNAIRFLFAVGLGVAATLAWQSYGGTARQAIAAHVPALAPAIATDAKQPTVPAASAQPGFDRAPASLETQPRAPEPAAAAAGPDLTPQIDAMARDLAALRQSVQQLGAGQEHVSRTLAKLQAAQEELGHRLAAPPALQQQSAPPPQPARRPAARPAQPSRAPATAPATQGTAPATQGTAPQSLAPGPRPLWQSFDTPPRRPPGSMP